MSGHEDKRDSLSMKKFCVFFDIFQLSVKISNFLINNSIHRTPTRIPKRIDRRITLISINHC